MNPFENATPPPAPTPDPDREPGRFFGGAFGLRVVGAMKLGSAVMLAAAGLGIFRMVNRDLGAAVEHFVSRLHLDPENRLVHEAVSRVSGLSRGQLKALGVGTFFYALLHTVEGTGLLLLRPWAEYLTVVATGLLLPLEIYEIAHRVTPIRVGIFVVNLAILGYVVAKLRQERRGG